VCPCHCHRVPVRGIHRFRYAVPWQVASAAEKGRLGVVFRKTDQKLATNRMAKVQRGEFVDWVTLKAEMQGSLVDVTQLLSDTSKQWEKLMHTLYETRRIVGSAKDLPSREGWTHARVEAFSALYRRSCTRPRAPFSQMSVWEPIFHWVWVAARGDHARHVFILVDGDPSDERRVDRFVFVNPTANMKCSYHHYLMLMVNTAMPFDGEGVALGQPIRHAIWSPQTEIRLFETQHQVLVQKPDSTLSRRLSRCWEDWRDMRNHCKDDPWHLWMKNWKSAPAVGPRQVGTADASARLVGLSVPPQLTRTCPVPSEALDEKNWTFTEFSELLMRDQWLYTGKSPEHESADVRMAYEQDLYDTLSAVQTMLTIPPIKLRPAPAMPQDYHVAVDVISPSKMQRNVTNATCQLPYVEFDMLVEGKRSALTPNAIRLTSHTLQFFFEVNADALPVASRQLCIRARLAPCLADGSWDVKRATMDEGKLLADELPRDHDLSWLYPIVQDYERSHDSAPTLLASQVYGRGREVPESPEVFRTSTWVVLGDGTFSGLCRAPVEHELTEHVRCTFTEEDPNFGADPNTNEMGTYFTYVVELSMPAAARAQSSGLAPLHGLFLRPKVFTFVRGAIQRLSEEIDKWETTNDGRAMLYDALRGVCMTRSIETQGKPLLSMLLKALKNDRRIRVDRVVCLFRKKEVASQAIQEEALTHARTFVTSWTKLVDDAEPELERQLFDAQVQHVGTLKCLQQMEAHLTASANLDGTVTVILEYQGVP
jgi:hypothetical protein